MSASCAFRSYCCQKDSDKTYCLNTRNYYLLIEEQSTYPFTQVDTKSEQTQKMPSSLGSKPSFWTLSSMRPYSFFFSTIWRNYVFSLPWRSNLNCYLESVIENSKGCFINCTSKARLEMSNFCKIKDTQPNESSPCHWIHSAKCSLWQKQA